MSSWTRLNLLVQGTGVSLSPRRSCRPFCGEAFHVGMRVAEENSWMLSMLMAVMWMSRVSVIQVTHTLTLRDTHFHESVISELWFIKQNRRMKEMWALISSCTRLKAGEAKRLCAAFQSFAVFCLFLLFVCLFVAALIFLNVVCVPLDELRNPPLLWIHFTSVLKHLLRIIPQKLKQQSKLPSALWCSSLHQTKGEKWTWHTFNLKYF